MNRLYTLFAAFLVAISITAQDDAIDETFQFVKADGTVVANGSTITVSELEEDDFGGFFINTGLFVKNVSGTNETLLRVAYDITEMANGSFQICFPRSCVSRMMTGSYVTDHGALEEGSVNSLQCEWFPEEYGICTATLTIELMEQRGMFPRYTYEKVATGPTVNVIFNYSDPEAIDSYVAEGSPRPVSRYTLDGRTLPQCRKGLSIVRQQNGTVRKVVTR